MADTRLQGQVRIVGAGLLGASIGLGLVKRGVDVILADSSKANLKLAIDYGAGRSAKADDQPSLIVVAVPPDTVADTVAEELAKYPHALVTDVASVKNDPLQQLRDRGADLSRYLGTHPMAGRERSGPIAARADLFVGRPWVIAGHDAISYRNAGPIEDMILDLGATPVEMTAESHDKAVALVSHVPQLVSSLLAGRLVHGESFELNLAGQGLRDTTRIAASSPELWLQILHANSEPVLEVLRALQTDLTAVITALTDLDRSGAVRCLVAVLDAGNQGVQRIPGKHGSKQQFSTIVVLIDDKPGQLARLLTEIGEIGINLEDLRLEHSPEAQIGIVEVQVLPNKATELTEALIARGWRVS